MTWREQLQPASFRGVQFRIADAETLFGRRNELHEYPLRDEPYGEDLGRKAREFTINAYIIGEDYYGQRDALISAIEDNNAPGTLVHPTLGTKNVIPKDCRVVFNNKEGGLEYFKLTFVEAGEARYPAGLIDTSFFSGDFATSALSTFSDYFGELFSVDGFPDFISTNALSNVNSLSSLVQDILGFGDTSGSEYSAFSEIISNFNSNASTNLTDPSTLGSSITDMVSGLSDMYMNTNNSSTQPYLSQVLPENSQRFAMNAQKRLFEFGDDFVAVPETTADRTQEALNQNQLVSLVKNASAAEMIRITSIMDFPSRQDALSVRDEVDDYLQQRLIAMADDGEDEPYLALNKARAAMIKDVNTRAASLKDVKTIRTNDAVPALVLAYDQYEDAELDAEIIARNRVRNPLFVPGNSDIEILV